MLQRIFKKCKYKDKNVNSFYAAYSSLSIDVYVMLIEVKKERGTIFNPVLPCVF
jgi:hypothetical protein